MIKELIKNNPMLYKAANNVVYNVKKRKNLKYTDEEYIAMQYKKELGKNLNIDNPQTFNEKVQWLKLNYRNPDLNKYVDKYEVREYVSEKIGEHVLNEIYGVYDKLSEIKIEQLPDRFVLKGTHDCGSVVICENKDKFNWKKEQIKLIYSLTHNHYYYSREWAYKDVKPRIISEKFLSDDGNPPEDYKIFCFNGVPKLIQVDLDRFGGHKRNIYDTDWNYLDFEMNSPKGEDNIKKPTKLDEMLKYAEILSEDFPFVRVDFYEIDNKVIFGELTFYPAGGHSKFNPEEYDYILGDMLMLPKS